MPEDDTKVTNGKSQGEKVACVYCGSTDTEMIGLFGAFHLASQYFCRSCHSPFALVKWQPEKPHRAN